jgi:uncharacterized small protein (DUF1192 family)
MNFAYRVTRDATLEGVSQRFIETLSLLSVAIQYEIEERATSYQEEVIRALF